jgi:hypothetical protein
VHTVACVAVNDPFVMDAWSKAAGGKGKVLFLSTATASSPRPSASISTAAASGLGLRSMRYAMLVDDGVVTVLNVEQSPGVADVSTCRENCSPRFSGWTRSGLFIPPLKARDATKSTSCLTASPLLYPTCHGPHSVV